MIFDIKTIHIKHMGMSSITLGKDSCCRCTEGTPRTKDKCIYIENHDEIRPKINKLLIIFYSRRPLDTPTTRIFPQDNSRQCQLCCSI